MIKINKETWLLILIEILSGVFGVIGVILGIFSLISLNPDIWAGTIKSREHTSMLFTIATVVFDSLSTLTAIIAFKYSGWIIKQKAKKQVEITIAEKYASKLDLYSFIFGLIGLILSILSLLFLFPFLKTEPGSTIATILSIISDSTSAFIVIWVVFIMFRIERNKALK